MDILSNVLESYPLRIKQTQIVKMQMNSGQAEVRRLGTQLATGDYIIHCDIKRLYILILYDGLA